MMELAKTLQGIVLCGSIVVLAAIALGYAAYALSDVAKMFRRKVGAIMGAALFVVCAIYYGGSKSVFRFDTGLTNNGSYTTNNLVHAAWTFSGIPSASAVYIACRESGSTNEWAEIAETVASARVWDGTLANATNYDFWVYSSYIPPEPVHTNGVWQGPVYETKPRKGASGFVIIGGEVREHGRTIAPPAAKRKEEEE